MFFKVPWVRIDANFEGGARAEKEHAPKKRNFLVKIFRKFPKNAFFWLFLKFCLPRRKFGQKGVFRVI